jgi:uncharacterized protein YbjT (DUF2867 family)
MSAQLSIVMLGATGAVGGATLKTLLTLPSVARLTLLGRRPVAMAADPRVTQHTVDALNPSTYSQYLPGHDAAVCTLGVGQPGSTSREEFVRVDKNGPLAFGKACRQAGIGHFELLGGAAANARSPSFYMRTKGELENELKALGFPRLSLFRPSMILTPTNRYGFSQAVVLVVWPWLDPLFMGPFRKFRGVRVETLGAAIARNLFTTGSGTEVLHWDEYQRLTQ